MSKQGKGMSTFRHVFTFSWLSVLLGVISSRLLKNLQWEVRVVHAMQKPQQQQGCVRWCSPGVPLLLRASRLGRDLVQ